MLVKCADELIDDREQLQQYLKDIYTIETERYSLQEAEEELKYRTENEHNYCRIRTYFRRA